MASNYTSNYGLCQWEAEDKVIRTDFNEDNAKIDAALKAEADARTIAVNNLSSSLNSQTAALAKKGNCQIFTTTYVGTGEIGETNPVRINLPGKPVFVIVTGNRINTLFLVNPGASLNIGTSIMGGASVRWGTNYVSWYSERSSDEQFNTSGITYNVAAFLSLG